MLLSKGPVESLQRISPAKLSMMEMVKQGLKMRLAASMAELSSKKYRRLTMIPYSANDPDDEKS